MQELLVHSTGCARSEGYYKIDARDKVKYLPHHRRKLRLNEKVWSGSGSCDLVWLSCDLM